MCINFIVQVNCEKEQMTCKKHKITGFPKIIAFYQGSAVCMFYHFSCTELKFITTFLFAGVLLEVSRVPPHNREVIGYPS